VLPPVSRHGVWSLPLVEWSSWMFPQFFSSCFTSSWNSRADAHCCHMGTASITHMVTVGVNGLILVHTADRVLMNINEGVLWWMVKSHHSVKCVLLQPASDNVSDGSGVGPGDGAVTSGPNTGRPSCHQETVGQYADLNVVSLTLRCPLLPYGYSYTASCARPG